MLHDNEWPIAKSIGGLSLYVSSGLDSKMCSCVSSSSPNDKPTGCFMNTKVDDQKRD